jgi:hypothetical protein
LGLKEQVARNYHTRAERMAARYGEWLQGYPKGESDDNETTGPDHPYNPNSAP